MGFHCKRDWCHYIDFWYARPVNVSNPYFLQKISLHFLSKLTRTVKIVMLSVQTYKNEHVNYQTTYFDRNSLHECAVEL